jgi:hypothetical protein
MTPGKFQDDHDQANDDGDDPTNGAAFVEIAPPTGDRPSDEPRVRSG